MMVPRAFMYATSTPTKPVLPNEKVAMSKPDVERKSGKKSVEKDESTKPARLLSAFSPQPSALSGPAVIPTKTKYGGKRRLRDDPKRQSKKAGNSPSQHDNASVSPETAALLAMTSTPDQEKSMATRSQPRPIARKIQQIRHHGTLHHSPSSSNPQTWDFLLSPPQEHDMQHGSFESDAPYSLISSVWSMSTESMPSLIEDEDSVSSSSNPGTPGLVSMCRSDRRSKYFSTSVGEICSSDHPLMPLPPTHNLHPKETTKAVSIESRPSPTKSKTSFKSNLTASLRAIRSAARSISDFTAPVSLLDDYLSRSVLSMDIPFTDERRPRPSSDPPNPALRRYLNPTALSPAELHFHLDRKSDPCQASIQLQSYEPGPRHSCNATAPPVFLSNLHQPKLRQGHVLADALDTEDAHTSSLLPRQREPRENSDFLRVIVLEMNMRKVGKLSDASPGRARLWLPARQTMKTIDLRSVVDDKTQMTRDSVNDKQMSVPLRWEGVRH
ncbi:MAG: hypothetical protein Q9164_000059 [Protoblastenia rupestris]